MPTDAENPYAAPALEPRVVGWVTRVRIVAAAISCLVGAASFALGLFAIGAMLYVIVDRPNHPPVHLMLAACTLYLAFGTAWMFAGWCYWKKIYRLGLIATGIGVSIPVVLLSIFGL